jgi:glutamate/tyrosine decarboxylase-like PLP-dependent enzyme
MSVQTFGMEAFRSAVSRGIELADRASDYVKASELLEMLCPASLGIVCFRANPRDSELDEGAIETLNARIQDRVIATETAMMSSTRLRGRYSLRLCIMNHLTIWRDVEETLGMIERFLLEEMKQGSMESSSRRRR